MSINVLYAEDNELAREITLSLLNDSKINLTIACDGLEALELFINSEKNDFDVILMDLVMPNMNGFESAAKIRNSNHPNAKQIPIIALTANDDCIDDANLFNKILSKPIEKKVLFNVLNEIKK